jgi:hypothetical protein
LKIYELGGVARGCEGIECAIPGRTCGASGRLDPPESGGFWWGTFYEFEAVAPGVFGVEVARAGDGIVVRDIDAASEESLTEFIEIGSDESEMTFLAGRKFCSTPM